MGLLDRRDQETVFGSIWNNRGTVFTSGKQGTTRINHEGSISIRLTSVTGDASPYENWANASFEKCFFRFSRGTTSNLRGEVFLTGLIVFLNAFGLQNFVIDGKFVQPSLPGAIELGVVSEEKVT